MYRFRRRSRCALWLATLLVNSAVLGRAAEPSAAPVRLPNGVELARVEFESHIMPLVGRLGCNSAACHGSLHGKGGLKLSLFGQSSESDFAALLDPEEQRIDSKTPDASLLLAKVRGEQAHGGGVRAAPDRWEYQVLRHWIAAGASRGTERSPVRRLLAVPAEPPPLNPAQSLQLGCQIERADGTRDDVSMFAEFRSRDEAVAVVDANGRVQAREPGATTVVVACAGQFVAIPILVPFPPRVPPSPAGTSEVVPSASVLVPAIDEPVHRQLARLQLDLSPLSDDEEFLRRASLDVLGITPTVDEVRAFLQDTTFDKRSRKIEQLLHHPRRAVRWATRFCDWTACNVDQMEAPAELRPKRAHMWHAWFRQRFADNQPYDQLVHGVLCASSRNDESVDAWMAREVELLRGAEQGFATDYARQPSLDLFWRRLGAQGALPVEDFAELTASAFLGLRLRCARCHQHPYDRWTQADFAGYSQIFAGVHFGSSTATRQAVHERLERRRLLRLSGLEELVPEVPRLQEVFFAADQRRPLADAAAASDRRPSPPGAAELPGRIDPREELFQWLIRPDNPYFAPNFVNRTWAHYFGLGLVEPLDGFSHSNPATHPEVLQRLSDEFIRTGFDVLQLERTILHSATYQRSSRPTGNNASDTRHGSHAPIRPLDAAVVLDALDQALESSTDYGPDAPPGSSALDLAVNRFSQPEIQAMFQALGRRERRTLCECESSLNPSLRSELFLLSNPRLVERLQQGRVARWGRSAETPHAAIEDLYLATLSRQPTKDELTRCVTHIMESGSVESGLKDLAWALVNSREFLTNH